MNDGVEWNIRIALPSEAELVIAVVNEAAAWLDRHGIALWTHAELDPVQIRADVDAGYYVLAFDTGNAVGTMRFTLEDSLFWPEALPGEAGYVHRLAVRRSHAGKRLSKALLDWAALRTADLGRTWLRLDCEAKRPKLRALYEGFGFVFHSEHTVYDLFVARYQRRVRPSEHV
jgi:GNAT superfamily N-acetyltransferase